MVQRSTRILSKVKVEDHPSDLDPAPWVNFQGDRFMGRDGCMYLITNTPHDVDQLGNLIPKREMFIEENPPITDRNRSILFGFDES